MTGSGRATAQDEHVRVDVDAHSVNHRFLKTTVRTSGIRTRLDALVTDKVKTLFHRGHINVNVRVTRTETGTEALFDSAAFAAMSASMLKLANDHGLAAPTLRDVLSAPGVKREDTRDDSDDATLNEISTAVDEALGQLRQSREREGALLVAEVKRLLNDMDAHYKVIDQRASSIPLAYKQRLKERLDALLEGEHAEPDPEQLAREVASLADRSDIREELARLDAHIKHAHTLLSKGGDTGRSLDFLVQEFHREANTISSKSSDIELTQVTLDLKRDIERLREQVQNIE